MMGGGTTPPVGGIGGICGVTGGANSGCSTGTVEAGAHAGIPSIHTMVCGVNCPAATICLQES